MIRVVLDTNIVVSGLLQPLGPSARILILALSDAVQFCVSGPVYEEYEDVLRRPRLNIREPIIAKTLDEIKRRGRWMKSPPGVNVCADPDDDIFVACAAAARADYIVTGNIRDFPSLWKATAVVTPRRFLDIEFPEPR